MREGGEGKDRRKFSVYINASKLSPPHRLHTTLQGKLRPLQAKMTSMKASRSEYSEKLRHQERKVKVCRILSTRKVVTH